MTQLIDNALYSKYGLVCIMHSQFKIVTQSDSLLIRSYFFYNSIIYLIINLFFCKTKPRLYHDFMASLKLRSQTTTHDCSRIMFSWRSKGRLSSQVNVIRSSITQNILLHFAELWTIQWNTEAWRDSGKPHCHRTL